MLFVCWSGDLTLFSDGSLSLRADLSGRPKLPGSDSRLNLVHLFAASCWCGLFVSETAVVVVCLSGFCFYIESLFSFFSCFLLRVILCNSVKNDNW